MVKILRALGVAAIVAIIGCLAFGCWVLSQGAFAQQIPGAPAGVISLSWWNSSGANVSIYNDAGFAANPATSSGVGELPNGNWYVGLGASDAGTLYTGAMAVDRGRQAMNFEIVAVPSGLAAAAGVLQPQTSNDGTNWLALGTPQTMDGGVGPYEFNITAIAAPLIRVEYLNSSDGGGSISASAFP